VSEPSGRLAALLRSGTFAVTSEVVPPLGGSGEGLATAARGLVGYVDAVNVPDNPVASAHMSPVAGVRLLADAGVEATLQLTTRDRNRLALTGDLLGGWAMGARNVLCLTGDPLAVGDHPEARPADDLSVTDLVRLVRRLRDDGVGLGGSEVADPPRFLVGVADVPLAEPYDTDRLAAKLEAGADVIWTQIAYEPGAIAAWLERVRPLGVPERIRVLVGVVPLRSARQARSLAERLPGVTVPEAIVRRLDEAGPAAEDEGLAITVEVVDRLRALEGVAGVHLMGMGRDDLVRSVVERAGLFPRPSV
jgi:methylenetetrahydrofolate reductase (NADPH)